MTHALFSVEQLSAWLEEIVRTQFRVTSQKITPESRLREDLDLDSIDLFDLLVHLEKKTSVSIDGDELRNVRTVSDLIQTLLTLLNAKCSKGS